MLMNLKHSNRISHSCYLINPCTNHFKWNAIEVKVMKFFFQLFLALIFSFCLHLCWWRGNGDLGNGIWILLLFVSFFFCFYLGIDSIMLLNIRFNLKKIHWKSKWRTSSRVKYDHKECVLWFTICLMYLQDSDAWLCFCLTQPPGIYSSVSTQSNVCVYACTPYCSNTIQFIVLARLSHFTLMFINNKYTGSRKWTSSNCQQRTSLYLFIYLFVSFLSFFVRLFLCVSLNVKFIFSTPMNWNVFYECKFTLPK